MVEAILSQLAASPQKMNPKSDGEGDFHSLALPEGTTQQRNFGQNQPFIRQLQLEKKDFLYKLNSVNKSLQYIIIKLKMKCVY